MRTKRYAVTAKQWAGDPGGVRCVQPGCRMSMQITSEAQAQEHTAQTGHTTTLMRSIRITYVAPDYPPKEDQVATDTDPRLFMPLRGDDATENVENDDVENVEGWRAWL